MAASECGRDGAAAMGEAMGKHKARRAVAGCRQVQVTRTLDPRGCAKSRCADWGGRCAKSKLGAGVRGQTAETPARTGRLEEYDTLSHRLCDTHTDLPPIAPCPPSPLCQPLALAPG